MKVTPAADYDYNSPQNLAVKKKFCAREICGCATDIAEYLLADMDGTSPLKWGYDEVSSSKCKCPYCGEELDMDILMTTYDKSIAIHVDEDAPDEEKYLCPLCASGYPTEEEARECCGSRMVYQCSYCQSAVAAEEIEESTDEEFPDEWYIVTDWLGEILAAKNETVLTSVDGIHFWGCRGTANPEKHKVISEICYDLEILEGQDLFREVK